jgi:hypothetical protein
MKNELSNSNQDAHHKYDRNNVITDNTSGINIDVKKLERIGMHVSKDISTDFKKSLSNSYSMSSKIDFLENESKNNNQHMLSYELIERNEMSAYDNKNDYSNAKYSKISLENIEENIDVKSEGMIHEKIHFSSFKSLISYVSKSKEPVLYSFLLNDFSIISFDSAVKIRFYAKNNLNLVNELKKFLEKITGDNWNLELVNDAFAIPVSETFGIISTFNDISQNDVILELKSLLTEEDYSIIDIEWGME